MDTKKVRILVADDHDVVRVACEHSLNGVRTGKFAARR
jgi:hypothetical protein